ncbi:MAG: branched-chain amino acid ABC transporter permease [Candidatus Liberibacter europaeus]|uniref:Branched-chain amino acid ABC transporter permease n=1 Tax=Candidatus Liberibacter europaeus TaxID=744859 RepID=A0A2T4VWT7_9HYPH|nr:branched-chain amino acid ABC transporter permease [Candidatus Liberibacter europaeus]PTL86220.1 MAG: branched-chain amino acid ABC transporter permease [Candidatus Liberibacter europaeus]
MSKFLPRVKIPQKMLLKIFYFVFAIYPIAILFFFGVSKSQRYIDGIGIQILIYIILAWGLSIVVGSAGLLSLNYIIAYAVGAYSYAILGSYYYFSPWLLLLISALISGMCGVILCIPSLRFRGDFLAIITLIMNEIFQMLIIRWKKWTNGNIGIDVSERLMFLGVDLEGMIRYFRLPVSMVYYNILLYYLLLCLCLLSAWIIMRLRRSYTGNVWRAIQDNHRAFVNLNRTVVFAKLSAFVISSMFAGVCGALLAALNGYVSPYFFTSSDSIILVAIIILGGMTSLSKIAGVVVFIIGGIEILCISNMLNPLLRSNPSFHEFRTALLIVLLFLVVLIRSYSLSRLRQPSPFLESKK